MNKKNLPLFILLILFFSSFPVFAEYPSFKGGAVLRDSLKIENDGTAYNLADELDSLWRPHSQSTVVLPPVWS